MTDLELLVFGAVVTFLAAAGAYVAIRHRANEAPVESYADYAETSSAKNAAPRASSHARPTNASSMQPPAQC